MHARLFLVGITGLSKLELIDEANHLSPLACGERSDRASDPRGGQSQFADPWQSIPEHHIPASSCCRVLELLTNDAAASL
jgi:hypothetical protein